MRIGLVTPYDLTHDGGVNRHVCALGRALERLGHQVRVLGPASGALPPACDRLGGVVPVRVNGSVARVGLVVSGRAMARLLARDRFDVVHVHEPWVPGVGRSAIRHAGVPLVATFHTFVERECVVSRLVRQALAGSLTRVAQAIAVSPAAADFARPVYGRPLHIIPNGVDVGLFAPAAIRAEPPGSREPAHTGSRRLVPGVGPALASTGGTALAVRPERTCAHPRACAHTASGVSGGGRGRALRVLFVGRYDEPRKGVRYLLEAVARLRREGRAITLHIAGPGVPHALADVAAAAGAEFLGRLDDAALAAAYQACDVFCAPSTGGESFGLVLLEAMAAGRPVIASDLRGYREASDGAACLVPAADAAALAAAIGALADDAPRQAALVARGLQRARALDWRRVAEAVAAVYRDTVASGVAACPA